jgi:UDP-GlcNAc:undecaprenyl-phosphate/decaprenyl-phosphate GlcNAc-1-phosphate transferase
MPLRMLQITGLLSLLTSLVLVPLVRRFAHQNGWISKPRADRWNGKSVALCGGIGIFGAYIISVSWSLTRDVQLLSILIAGVCIFSLGLIDDFIHIKPSSKLIGQMMCAAIAIYSGNVFHFFGNEVFNILCSFFWIVAITNALNLLDNMDGLAAGIGIIAAAFLAAVFFNEGQFAFAAFAVALCGSLLGFLKYNFYPASIFMGDCGSLFIGFTLALLSMKTSSLGSAITAIAVPSLVLSVPILDMTYVSITRIMRGQSVAVGGKDHTSHCLISLGLSERRAALTLYSLATVSGLLAYWINSSPNLPNLILLPVILIVFSILGVYLAHMTYDLHPRRTDKVGERSPWMTNLLVHLTFKRRIFEIFLDFVLIAVCYHLAYALRFDFKLPQPYLASFTKSLPLIILVTYGCFFAVGIYRGIWRFTGTRDAIRFLAGSVLSVLVAVLAVVLLYRFENFSRSVFPIYGILLFVAVSVTRLSFKMIGITIQSLRKQQLEDIPVLIYGAGEGGELALREIQKQNGNWNLKPVGFIDDDNKKHRLKIHGVPILGTHRDLEKIHKKLGFRQLIISSSHIPSDTIQQMLAYCADNEIEVKRFRLVVETISA